MKSVNKTITWLLGGSIFLISVSCANIKLASSENNQFKFCTNPNNQIAKQSDFDEAAEKQCGGRYRFIKGGMEFFTDPNTPKLAGIFEVQKERHMCRVYECVK